MKPETSKVYMYSIIFGAWAGYSFSAAVNCGPDLGMNHDTHFLADITASVLCGVAGGIGGAGLAAVYHAGKGVYNFCKKKISSENKKGLEKLIEK